VEENGSQERVEKENGFHQIKKGSGSSSEMHIQPKTRR